MYKKTELLRDKKYRDALASIREAVDPNNPEFQFMTIVSNGKEELIWDLKAGLIWNGNPNIFKLYKRIEDARQVAEQPLAGFDGWRLPKFKEILEVAKNIRFPLRQGKKLGFLGNKYYWWIEEGCFDLDKNCLKSTSVLVSDQANVIQVANFSFNTENIYEILDNFVKKGYSLKNIAEPTTDLLGTAKKYSPNISIGNITEEELTNIWEDVDYIQMHLPKLDSAEFFDPNKGIWEFHNSEFIKRDDLKKIVSRDPSLDVKEWDVAIDFGTSSTVVAFREHGRFKLLRIGMDEEEFKKELDIRHFENPTLLEFIDFKAMMGSWVSEAYRPLVDWSTVHCSHKARVHLAESQSKTEVVSSILTRIKQWAALGYGESKQNPVVIITDQNKNEIQLTSYRNLRQSSPVRDKPMTIEENYPFDPIELYAWYLGLSINLRGRGLFLRYYMTFPTKYGRDVKDKILNSFQRGLQRSLPETLANQPEYLRKFTVEECASETAAYAIAAIQAQEFRFGQSKDRLAYAVFDFGGGTADFDFGFYRLSNEEEDEEGWDAILEHIHDAGDPFLGGENLLQQMAYLVLQKNKEICRRERIKFIIPPNADDFPDREGLIDDNQIAQANSEALIPLLRPLWEGYSQTYYDKNDLEASLRNSDGKYQSLKLEFSKQELITYLKERIGKGIQDFYDAMKAAFKNQMPQEIHVFLGGNSCHSEIVKGYFGLLESLDAKELYDRARTWMPPSEEANIIIHPPLIGDPDNPYAPTAKTGVALGLLELCPGGNIKYCKPKSPEYADASFQFEVGHIRRKEFIPCLKRGADYTKWVEIGRARQGVFILAYSQISRRMNEGDLDLRERRLEFSNQTGIVFAKPRFSNSINLCLAQSKEDIEEKIYSDYQEISLIL